MSADNPSLGISVEKPQSPCSPVLMRGGTFSCSPQTVAVAINSQSNSGAHTEVDYSDMYSKLRACCAMRASPMVWFTLLL